MASHFLLDKDKIPQQFILSYMVCVLITSQTPLTLVSPFPSCLQACWLSFSLSSHRVFANAVPA